MARKITVTAALILGLCACAELSPAEAPEADDRCAAFGKLLQSYQQQFADIRGTSRTFDRITIWSTRYQLVGSGCEIWGWQGGKYNYVCNYVAPDEASARTIYRDAVEDIEACASEPWHRSERQIQGGVGLQSVWKRPDFSGVVDLKLVQTRGISTPRWAIYLLIGDYNSQL